MPVCPPHTRVPTACLLSLLHTRVPTACLCPCCTLVSLPHLCPRCVPGTLLHIHVPIICPCPDDTPVSPPHAHVPAAHPRPHHTLVSPWHLRAPMALSRPHRPHIPMAPPLRCTPPHPSLPGDPPSAGMAAVAPGVLTGDGGCHTRTRTNLGPDTHVPLGGGRRPGRGDREPLNPPAPGLRLLLLLLHPPPAVRKGGGGRKGHKLGLLVPSAGLYWEDWEDWGAPSLASSAEQPSPASHVGVRVPLGGVDVCFAGFCIIFTETVLAAPARG